MKKVERIWIWLVVIVLLISGCQADPVLTEETAVPPTPTASRTPLPPTETATQPVPTDTALPPTAVSPTQTPAPPTPTYPPTPTLEPLLLPAFVQAERPLTGAWYVPEVRGHYLPNRELGDLFVYISTEYGSESAYPHTLFVTNADSGTLVWQRPLPENFERLYVDQEAIFLLYEADDTNSTYAIEAINPYTQETLWKSFLPFSQFEPTVFLTEDELYLSDYRYQTEQLVSILLNQDDGQVIWQKEIRKACIGWQVFTVAEQIMHVCRTYYLFLSFENGDVLNSKPYDETAYHIVAATNAVIEFHYDSEQQAGYLQAFDAVTYASLWRVPAPMNVQYTAVNDQLLIYRSRNVITAVSLTTGQTEWQTTLDEYAPSTMLIHNNILLVGSRTGFLHLVDVRSGELLWTENIWASVALRPIVISPETFLDDGVLIRILDGFLALSPNGELHIGLPTNTPVATRIPLPTSTPHRVFTPPASNAPITLSDDINSWPSEIVAYLNSAPTDLARLEALANWMAANQDASLVWQPFEDVNGETKGIVLLIDSRTNLGTPGWFVAVVKDTAGFYQMTLVESALNPFEENLLDLNNDGQLDFVYQTRIFGANFSGDSVTAILWDGEAFTPAGTISMANMLELTIEDVDDNGRLEIILYGGEVYSPAGGLTRLVTETYAIIDNQYELVSEQPDLPQDYYFFVMDANALFLSEQYEAAIDLYSATLPIDETLHYVSTPHARAFAELQIMLAYLLLGDEQNAELWAIKSENADTLYGEVKTIFWQTYQETGEWVQSAEAARLRVRQAGYDEAQLSPWIGYLNTALTLEMIIPCSDCLQGSLGDPWR